MRGSEGEQEGAREVGSNGNQGVCFEDPTTCRRQVLGCRQPLLGQDLLPSLPSLPMDQAEVVGNGHQMVCFGVPTTCWANFWGAHHFS